MHLVREWVERRARLHSVVPSARHSRGNIYLMFVTYSGNNELVISLRAAYFER